MSLLIKSKGPVRNTTVLGTSTKQTTYYELKQNRQKSVFMFISIRRCRLERYYNFVIDNLALSWELHHLVKVPCYVLCGFIPFTGLRFNWLQNVYLGMCTRKSGISSYKWKNEFPSGNGSNDGNNWLWHVNLLWEFPRLNPLHVLLAKRLPGPLLLFIKIFYQSRLEIYR